MRSGPKFVSCAICFRPVLEHSLSFHESKCAEIREQENLNNSFPPKIKTPPVNGIMTVRKLSPSKATPDVLPTVSSGPIKVPASSPVKVPASNNQVRVPAGSPVKVPTNRSFKSAPQQLPPKVDRNLLHFNVDGPRPGTMTLRGRSSSLDTPQSAKAGVELVGPAGMRVCFVCGQRFGKNSLDIHEKKCLHFWHCMVNKLPNFVKFHEPKKLQYHSIDGTVDYERIDLMAQQTSMLAQRVDCERCKKTVQLADVKEHVTKCKPKPKNAKKKSPFDRDFYVTMF